MLSALLVVPGRVQWQCLLPRWMRRVTREGQKVIEYVANKLDFQSVPASLSRFEG